MRSMRTQINLANVKVYSGIEPDGDEYLRCRVTFLGDKVALWKFWEGKFMQVDVLSNVTMVEVGKQITLKGTSRALVTEVGLEPENAQVRWEIEEIGCPNCR